MFLLRTKVFHYLCTHVVNSMKKEDNRTTYSNYTFHINEREYMKKRLFTITACLLLTLSLAGQSIKSVSHQRILIDSRYAPDEEGEKTLLPYRNVVDSIMKPVVGHSAKYMKAHNPESELSNLLADIMVWGGKIYAESPDIGFYNAGGIRAALPEGDITFGDINDMAPFDNRICFATLTGEQLLTLFQQIGRGYGFGVSHGVKVVYREKELVSITLHDKDIDPQGKYRMATIVYLMHGNDSFAELAHASFVVSPQDEHALARNVIASYFREKKAAGETVDAFIEGRVKKEKK